MKLSFRHFYFRWSKNLLFLFVFFAALMSLARGAFALTFGDIGTLTFDLAGVRSAMLLGLRYDLMPLAYVTALPFLVLNFAYLFPGKATIKVARFLIVSVLCLGIFAIIWIFFCDYAFYSYFQDHINILFFGLFEDDTMAVLISVWKNYNLPLWLFVIFAVHYVLYRFIKFLFSPFEFDLRVRRFDWRYPVIFLGGLVFLVFCARGNFTRLPLSIEDAHISENEFINKISINGPLSLNRTIKIRKTFGKGDYDYLRTYGYESWQGAFKDAFGLAPKKKLLPSLVARTPKNAALEANPPHVILVVMESFGSYWNDHDSDSFNLLGELKAHLGQGIHFKNFLSAENGTIGSIVSVATSQVIRPGARFLSESDFMNTPLSSAGHAPYKEKGYTTHFIYGGKLGWRDLGKFLKVQGYDKLWGADEIKEAMPELANLSPTDLGNEWGIFDEYLYAFIEEKLRTATKPQFFMVLTTSNHPPFEYPASYRPLPFKLTDETLRKLTLREDLALKRFLALQYSNQKMGEFLTRSRESVLRDKLVIALTGDHSFWIAKGVGLEEEFKRYAVPFFISVPEALKPESVDATKFGSHEDIFPTLYHLTLSDQKYTKLGQNLLGEDSSPVNSRGIVADKNGAWHNGRYWKWKNLDKQILEPTQETPELYRLRKQLFGVIGITDAYLKEEKKGTRSGAGNGQR